LTMLKLANMTIRDKLISIIMLVSLIALMLTGLVLFGYVHITFRNSMVQDILTDADMTADNCNVALTFRNVEDVEKTLASLKSKSSIVFGGVYTADGEIFSSYYRKDSDSSTRPSELKKDGYYFGNGFLTVFKSIVLDDEKIGTLCIRSDLKPLSIIFKNSTTVIAIVLILSLTIAYFLSARLQKIISASILSLADTAKAVSEKKDYSTRAVKQSNDEIGSLIDAFNEMLEQIQQHDLTLVSTNEKLSEEIDYRKQAEEALRESKQRLTTVLNSILTGVIIVDAETHKIADANPLAMKLIGLPIGEIIGKVCHKFICPAEEGKCPISDLGQSVDQSERTLINGRGECIPILKSVTHTEWQGREFLVESFIDISDRKKAEQTLQNLNKELEATIDKLSHANRELADFAHAAAHDLKSPLRAIGSLADILSIDYRGKLDKQGKEYLDIILSRTKRMSELISSILSYSEISNVVEQKEYTDLNIIVKEAISFVNVPENIEITIENQLPKVFCEKTRITQVLQNLIDNAVKYMDKSQGWIKIGCVEKDDRWKLSISDNGPGINKKYFGKIFQIFQTLARRDEREATGVGLAEVKKIVEAHNGKVWVESKLGEGSTFFFTLAKKEREVTNVQLQVDNVN